MAVQALDEMDPLATRLADMYWAQRSRKERRRWAVVLALAMTAVVGLTAFFLSRATGDSTGPWLAGGGLVAWFGVFLLLLVPSPKAAVMWMLISPLLFFPAFVLTAA